MKTQIPKGTFDILPYGTKEAWRLSGLWQHVESVINGITNDYGYHEIRTPIYELSSLFDRGVGETSDIVTKEMFTFEDKGGRSLSLRPEGTSSVMRSFIENRLSSEGNVHKLFYTGPMFRYERPQSGRYRQHHQFGVEAIGNPGPEQDAEVIDLLCQFYNRLGLKNLTVHLNSVGDLESRANFKEALLNFLKPHLQELSADSQIRFEKNPLRILDSKDPKDKVLLESAPSILNYLTPSSEKHFQMLCSHLKLLNIPYLVNDKIVRGLDYYSKTVFEVLTGDLGAQNTIGAGGRFDGLLSTFGGPDLPAVGFATGLERVLQVMVAQKIDSPTQPHPLVYFIPMGEEAKEECLKLTTLCRHNQIGADAEWNAKKMQTAIQNGLKLGATYCAIIGSDELKNKTVQLKHLKNRTQKEMQMNNLVTYLKEVSNA